LNIHLQYQNRNRNQHSIGSEHYTFSHVAQLQGMHKKTHGATTSKGHIFCYGYFNRLHQWSTTMMEDANCRQTQ